MHNREELTDYQKGRIEGRSQSKTHTKIGKKLNIPRRTVSNFLQCDVAGNAMVMGKAIEY